MYCNCQYVIISNLLIYASFNCLRLEVFASDHGYEVVGAVRGFPGHYILRKLEHAASERGLEARHLSLALMEDTRVVWAEQQFHKQRVKREVKSIPEELLQLWQEEEAMERPEVGQRRDDSFNDELWEHQVTCLLWLK